MICLKTFENKTLNDFSSWNGWVNFVNDNNHHAIKFSTPFDYVGKCNEWELPSFHPYWSNKIKQNIAKDLISLMSIYEECKKDTSKIKYHFNLTTSVKDIEGMIKNKKDKIKGVVYN